MRKFHPHKNTNHVVATNARRIATEKGISDETIAQALDLSLSTVKKKLNAASPIYVNELIGLAVVLKTSPRQLLLPPVNSKRPTKDTTLAGAAPGLSVADLRDWIHGISWMEPTAKAFHHSLAYSFQYDPEDPTRNCDELIPRHNVNLREKLGIINEAKDYVQHRIETLSQQVEAGK